METKGDCEGTKEFSKKQDETEHYARQWFASMANYHAKTAKRDFACRENLAKVGFQLAHPMRVLAIGSEKSLTFHRSSFATTKLCRNGEVDARKTLSSTRDCSGS